MSEEHATEDQQQYDSSGSAVAAPSSDNTSTVDITQADDSKKLFVGGLHWETNEEDLKEYFSQFGNVVATTIKMDRNTGKSRGFGFVLFSDSAEVEKAMNHPEHCIKGKKVDPKHAKPPMESKKKVFVGGMDPENSEDQIREYFQQFGKIENLDLPFDKTTGKRRAYIFVTYSTEAEAKEATKNTKQDIYGRQCDVRIAVPPEQVNRQKAWGQYGYGYDQGYGYGGYDQGYGYGYGGYDANSGYDPYGYPQQGYYDNSGGYDYYNYGGYGDQGYGYPGYPPAPPRGGGKIRGRGAAGNGAGPGYHPYNKPQ